MDFLSKIAPWLGAAAGGPPALLAMAAKEISEALGYDVPADGEKIATAVTGATQEQLVKLKELDQVFQLKMQELGFNHVESLANAANANNSSAREMNIAMQGAQPGWLAKNVSYIIDLVIILTALYLTYLLFFTQVPENNKDYVVMAFGSVWTLVGTVVNFHRGSSIGSYIKNFNGVGK